MKKCFKKALSTMLVLGLLLSLFPVNTLAAEDDYGKDAEVVESAVEEDTSSAAKTNLDDAQRQDEPSDSTDAEEDSQENESAVQSLDAENLNDDQNQMDVQAISIDKTQSVSLNTGEFYRIFHLDCGRKYFSIAQIEGIIDRLAANGYTHLELAVGNDGLRFLLDDMSVSANGTTYSDTAVKEGIQEGNRNYYNASTNELTQAEMDTLIDYAKSRDISVIPLINTPGHMDAILDAMESVGIQNPAYGKSARTVDVENVEAVNFTLALVNKYIQYFAGKGCTIFNMGCDEYANDVTNGFKDLQAKGKYGVFADYVNSMAAQVQNAGMTPMAFNDGIYYNNDTSVSFDDNIAIAYWTSGYSANKVAAASDLAEKGFKIINTSQNWYYVVGTSGSGWAGYETAKNGVQNTRVTDVPGNNDPEVAGAMICVWCDNPGAAYVEDEVTYLISTLAENNQAYFTVTNDETFEDEKDVTVAVGSTETVTISGENYSGDYTTANPSIAIVNVTGTDGSQATVNYTKVSTNPRWNELITDNGTVKTDYYQAKDGKYYQLSATKSSSGKIFGQYHYSLYYTDDTGTVSEVVNADTYNSNDQVKSDNVLYEKSGTEAVPASTTITFTGKQVGTTSVVIGTTKYNIKVTEQDLSNVESLKITRYLSTFRVYDVDNHENGNVINVSAQQAYGEEGIALTDVVPYKGWWQWAGDDIDTVLWKGVVLDNIDQSSSQSTDYSMSGTDYSYIRYYDNQWSYSADRVTWTPVKNTDYVNAYYLQKTEVTGEVDTYVKDWAFTPQNSSGKNENRYQKALSFAVVYPNGQLSPATENDIYRDSTLIYWDNLADLGFIRIGTNEIYEVEKLTYTLGERKDKNATSNWNTEDSINWNKKTVAGTSDQWYDETLCWDESYGTEPVINGADLESEIYAGKGNGSSTNYNGTWGANDAVLILIYLKPVESEDSLTVRYWDDSIDSQIYEYPLNITNTSTEDVGTFLNRLEQKSQVQVGEITLDDDAYVVNAKGVNEGFEKDLTKISALRGKYTSGLYNYIKAEISADGKTLILHYNLNKEKLQPYYIADFGLNIEIPFTDLGQNVVSVAATVPANANGTVSVDNDGKKIIFTANKAYSGITVLAVTATFTNGETQLYNVGIYPATTVYYEESFATGDFAPSGTAKNTTQQSLAYGNNSEHSEAYNYGYDGAYADDGVGASNGTEATSSKIGDDAVFTFTGTGLDVYANCTTETGAVSILVKSSKGGIMKLLQVDTSTGAAGSATTGQAVDSYNLPIASVSGLARDTYEVTIRHSKTDAEDTGKTVRLDGFRVYGTIDEASAIYQEDYEQSPNYLEMRNAVLTGLNVKDVANSSYYTPEELAGAIRQQVLNNSEDSASAVILDDSTSYTIKDVQDLLDNGPKNEVFLRSKQTLAFKLATGLNNVQIGLKAVSASGANYSITVGDSSVTKEVNLTSSTDMFYKLTSNTDQEMLVTITNNSGGILSVTDLKFFGEVSETALMSLEEKDFAAVLMRMNYFGDAEVDPKPTEPETVYADAALTVAINDEAGNELISTVLTVNGIVGESNIFTASEIKAAVEGLELPEGYKVDETAYADQEVAYGESDSVIFTASEKVEEPETTNIFNKIAASIANFFEKLFGFRK